MAAVWPSNQIYSRRTDRRTDCGTPAGLTLSPETEQTPADDPRLALKAFLPANQKANGEAESEALDILVLKEGYPAAVMPGEDHATRILVDLGWLAQLRQTNARLDPELIRAALARDQARGQKR